MGPRLRGRAGKFFADYTNKMSHWLRRPFGVPRRRESILSSISASGCRWIPAFAGMTIYLGRNMTALLELTDPAACAGMTIGLNRNLTMR